MRCGVGKEVRAWSRRREEKRHAVNTAMAFKMLPSWSSSCSEPPANTWRALDSKAYIVLSPWERFSVHFLPRPFFLLLWSFSCRFPFSSDTTWLTWLCEWTTEFWFIAILGTSVVLWFHSGQDYSRQLVLIFTVLFSYPAGLVLINRNASAAPAKYNMDLWLPCLIDQLQNCSLPMAVHSQVCRCLCMPFSTIAISSVPISITHIRVNAGISGGAILFRYQPVLRIPPVIKCLCMISMNVFPSCYRRGFIISHRFRQEKPNFRVTFSFHGSSLWLHPVSNHQMALSHSQGFSYFNALFLILIACSFPCSLYGWYYLPPPSTVTSSTRPINLHASVTSFLAN